MAASFVNSLQNLWPFSVFRFDDLRVSDQIIRKLPLPEYTKRFVFAIREPESQSVIYILCAQNLSERSALDTELLIREVRPDAVVVQVRNSSAVEIQSEERDTENPVPTSPLEVLKRCFIEKVNKEAYESIAGKSVLKEIFGVSFHGHVLAAKNAAKEAGSLFFVLEWSDICKSVENESSGEIEAGSNLQGLVRNLIPQKVGSVILSSSRQFNVTDDVQLKMVKLLSSHLKSSSSALKLRPLDSNLDAIQPRNNYEAPPFAQSIYSLLLDLHNIFVDLPSIGNALGHTQKMLYDVNRGEPVDSRIVSEISTFRVAVEGLRIALNNASRLPINKTRDKKSEFPELSDDEKSHVLFAKSLQSQAKKFKTTVAVVDASALAGIRKHWNTIVPPEVNGLVPDFATSYDDDWKVTNSSDRKWLLNGKPSMVAVGAGATAVLGASSLSKVVPASTFVKLFTFKVPLSLNIMLTQTQKAMAIALSKVKVVAPGLAKSGTSVWKGGASVRKIRAVSRSVIASAEKTSFSVMRTAFYEIMRKRQVKPISVLPLATFGCSVATCAGLLVYGDGIECVAESFPAAISIANLGRGVQSLQQASETVRRTDGNKLQSSIESLMYRLKHAKVQ